MQIIQTQIRFELISKLSQIHLNLDRLTNNCYLNTITVFKNKSKNFLLTADTDGNVDENFHSSLSSFNEKERDLERLKSGSE